MIGEMTDDAFAWWLAGFCDGEAHFGVQMRRSPSGSLLGAPRFGLLLRDDDLPVLEGIRTRLGVGKISRTDNSRARDAGRNVGDAASLGVHGLGGCLVVAEVLRGRLRAKKAREFEVWDACLIECAALPDGRGRRTPSKRAPVYAAASAELLRLRKWA